jgi:pimeloyl-ACP methyl ester carboxylesterase
MVNSIDRTVGGIAVTDYPSGADAGPALVFLHSLGLSRRTWRGPCQLLGERFRCLAVDVPGHGDSPRPRHFHTIPDLARAVLELARAQSIERCVVVGNSMGGSVAVAMALAAPEIVQSLILVGAAVWDCEPDRRAWLHSRSELFFHSDGSMKELGEEFTVSVFGSYDAERHRLMIEDQRAAADSIESAIWALYSYDIAAALGAVSQPVLAVYGGNDPYRAISLPVIRAHARQLTEYTVDGGSHLLPVDEPAALADRIRSWVSP